MMTLVGLSNVMAMPRRQALNRVTVNTRFASEIPTPPPTPPANVTPITPSAKPAVAAWSVDKSVLNQKGLVFRDELEVAVKKVTKKNPIPDGLHVEFSNVQPSKGIQFPGLTEIVLTPKVLLLAKVPLRLLRGSSAKEGKQDMAYVHRDGADDVYPVAREMGGFLGGAEKVPAYVTRVIEIAKLWKQELDAKAAAEAAAPPVAEADPGSGNALTRAWDKWGWRKKPD